MSCQQLRASKMSNKFNTTWLSEFSHFRNFHISGIFTFPAFSFPARPFPTFSFPAFSFPHVHRAHPFPAHPFGIRGTPRPYKPFETIHFRHAHFRHIHLPHMMRSGLKCDTAFFIIAPFRGEQRRNFALRRVKRTTTTLHQHTLSLITNSLYPSPPRTYYD